MQVGLSYEAQQKLKRKCQIKPHGFWKFLLFIFILDFCIYYTAFKNKQ